MGYYDTQQVCLNGHQITANYHQSPELRKDFFNYCHKCGTLYPWTEKRKKKRLVKLLESDSKNPLNSIERICMRFHLVAKQIHSRYNRRKTLDIEVKKQEKNWATTKLETSLLQI